jgi:hypothetical protein
MYAMRLSHLILDAVTVPVLGEECKLRHCLLCNLLNHLLFTVLLVQVSSLSLFCVCVCAFCLEWEIKFHFLTNSFNLIVPGVETAADPTNISEWLEVFSHIAEARFI